MVLSEYGKKSHFRPILGRYEGNCQSGAPSRKSVYLSTHGSWMLSLGPAGLSIILSNINYENLSYKLSENLTKLNQIILEDTFIQFNDFVDV